MRPADEGDSTRICWSVNARVTKGTQQASVPPNWMGAFEAELLLIC